jgi:hypothetical protein
MLHSWLFFLIFMVRATPTKRQLLIKIKGYDLLINHTWLPLPFLLIWILCYSFTLWASLLLMSFGYTRMMLMSIDFCSFSHCNCNGWVWFIRLLSMRFKLGLKKHKKLCFFTR